MSQIFSLIIGAVALQFVLCLAGSPREIDIQFEEFDVAEIVKKNEDWTNDAKRTLKEPISAADAAEIEEFENDEKNLENDDVELAAQEATEAQEARNNPRIKDALAVKRAEISQRWEDLELRRDKIAEAMTNAGHIVFVPQRIQLSTDAPWTKTTVSLHTGSRLCYIKLPKSDLSKRLEKIQTEKAILFRYVLSYPRKNIDSDQQTQDEDVKKITSIVGDKIFYKPLENNSPYKIRRWVFLYKASGQLERSGKN